MALLSSFQKIFVDKDPFLSDGFIHAEEINGTPFLNPATPSLFRLVASLCLLFLLLIAILWLFRRLSVPHYKQGLHKERITILETKAISQKTTLYLIKIQGSKILIAESQVNTGTLLEDTVKPFEPQKNQEPSTSPSAKAENKAQNKNSSFDSRS
ncbi:MAG: flagellar biosynthetic protein FliO [Chlamydiota bacterium]